MYEPFIGDYLGQFTNEIDASEGDEITEFASSGPKVYSYITNKGFIHTKVKGFSLNYNASKQINFEKLKEIIFNREIVMTESILQNQIIRKRKEWTLHSKESEKMFKMVYDKRVIMPDLTTLPYGFISLKI